MKRKGIIVTISIFSAIAILIGYSVYSRIKNRPDEKETVTGVPVVTAKPVIMDMRKIYMFTGNLSPKETVTVTSKIPGRIEKIFVTEGELVKKDTVLAKVEDKTARLQERQAYAAWQAAKAQYEKAIGGARKEQIENARALVKQAEEDLSTALENLKRAERLYKSGTIPKAQYEDTESKYRAAKTQLENAKRNLKMMEEGAQKEDIEMARANMEAAKARYDLANLQLDYTRIKAPITGQVAKIFVDEGNMIGQTTPILTLIQEDPIEADIAVPEKYYNEIQAKWKDIEIWIHPSSFPEGDLFRGKIVNVSNIIDPQTRTFNVKGEIGNSEGRLLPGMFVEARLVVEKRKNVVTVPVTSLVVRNGKKGIFVVENHSPKRARFIEVETGLEEQKEDGDIVEIVRVVIPDDINPNDNPNGSNQVSGQKQGKIKERINLENMHVIIDGNSFLEDGQVVVEVKPERSSQ